MKQYINLLPPSVIEPRDYTKFKTLSVLYGLVIVLCSVLVAAQWFYVEDLQAEADALASKSKAVESQVRVLTQQLESRSSDPALERQEQQLVTQLSSKQRLYQMLDKLQPQASGRFAEALYAVADAAVTDVWLTDIQVNQGATTLKLSGYALFADRIPIFLRALSQQATYSGMRFEELQIEQEEDTQRYKFFAIGQRIGTTNDE